MSNVRQTSPLVQLPSLINPPLLLSAAAECLAGAWIAGAGFTSGKAYLVALAAALIFAAGSVFGHYFDRELDAQHHPERPLPAGRVEPARAWGVGWVFLVPGLLLPALAGRETLLAAVGVGVLVVLYAAATKRQWGIGFLTLGAARAANFLMGMTTEEFGVQGYAAAALPVLAYATGWGLFRAVRQPGAPPSTPVVALTHLLIALSLLLYQALAGFAYRADSIALLIPFLAVTLPRYVNAVLDGRRPAVLEAVQYGFIGLTLLEGTLATGYAGFFPGAAVGLLGLAVYSALRKWPITLVTVPR